MMARKKRGLLFLSAPRIPLYMQTYGSIVTQVLCFFVLLFSMSSIDAEKYKLVTRSWRWGGGNTNPELSQADELRTIEEQIEIDTRHAARTIDAYLRTEGLDKSVRVVVSQRGVSVSMQDHFLFKSGDAELKDDGKRMLYEISGVIRNLSFPMIAVEGHTDSVPLNGGRYEDNWELSAARAGKVASYMEKEGNLPPTRLQATGYGGHRPIVPSDTPEHRALNRRVELVFLSQYPK